MASVNRAVCGLRNNESCVGVYRPDADIDSGLMFQNSVFDFRHKLRELPAYLQEIGATYTRASVKNVVQDGALVQLASGQFGTSYDSVTGKYGYVPEPAATNLCLYSEDINIDGSAVPWAHVGATVPSGSAIAPNSQGTAEKIIEDSGTSAHRVYQNFTFSTSTYTLSVFAKPAGRGYVGLRTPAGVITTFDITNGAVAVLAHTSAQIVPVGGGWYRCSITWTASAGASAFGFDVYQSGTTGNYLGDGSSGIYIWGAQLETGPRATSYIATAGSTATRAADVLSMPVANIPGFNSAAYTLFADGRIDAPSSVLRYLCAVDDGTTANFSQIAVSASETVGTYTTSASVSQASVSESAVSTARFKSGYSNSANSFLRAVGGVSGTSDVSGSMPASPTTVRIGCNSAGNQLNGYIFRAGIIPQALSQAQINGLTA